MCVFEIYIMHYCYYYYYNMKVSKYQFEYNLYFNIIVICFCNNKDDVYNFIFKSDMTINLLIVVIQSSLYLDLTLYEAV